MKPLILVGGGGHCKSVIEAAVSSKTRIVGILDVEQNVGQNVLGYQVVGTDDDIARYAGEAQFIITVGHIQSAGIRRKIAGRIKDAGGELGVVVASTANVSQWAEIGAGSVVLHSAMVNAGAKIGSNSIINTMANIEHDAVVGEFCHISTGAIVNGDCKVGQDVFLGSQSVMLNGAEICGNCVVAAGSFVRKSIKVPGIYAGNPAILMKKR